jgi:hypothetical protein
VPIGIALLLPGFQLLFLCFFSGSFFRGSNNLCPIYGAIDARRIEIERHKKVKSQLTAELNQMFIVLVVFIINTGNVFIEGIDKIWFVERDGGGEGQWCRESWLR